MANIRQLLTAQLRSTGEQLRKARMRLAETKQNPGFWPADEVQSVQDRVVELQHRYARIQDSFRCICY
jgi:hypothetical protein